MVTFKAALSWECVEDNGKQQQTGASLLLWLGMFISYSEVSSQWLKSMDILFENNFFLKQEFKQDVTCYLRISFLEFWEII